MTPVLRKLAPPPTIEDREEFTEKAKDAALVLIGAVRDDARPASGRTCKTCTRRNCWVCASSWPRWSPTISPLPNCWTGQRG